MRKTLVPKAKRQVMTYEEMTALFRQAERNGEHMTGYIVYSKSNWEKRYSEKARTYCVSSDNKAFKDNMCGYSIFAVCMDNQFYLERIERNGWDIEYCYIQK